MRRMALCLSILLMAIHTQAQRYPFFNIGIEQGLVQSQVFTLTQDSAGHLWAGTFGGLACYDGRVFRSYTVREGLPSNTITTLCCDRQGNVCIGTARGLSIYDGHRFRNYSFSSVDNPKGNVVMHLSVAANGELWCVAGNKPFVLRGGKVTPLPTPAAGARVTALRCAGNDVWIAQAGSASLYRYHSSSWDSLSLPEHRPQYVFKIYEEAAKGLIMLTGDGVYRYAQQGWSRLLERRSKREPLYYALATASDGSYWVSTSTGVIRLADGALPQYFNRANGLTDLLVYDLLRDPRRKYLDGNEWRRSVSFFGCGIHDCG